MHVHVFRKANDMLIFNCLFHIVQVSLHTHMLYARICLYYYLSYYLSICRGGGVSLGLFSGRPIKMIGPAIMNDYFYFSMSNLIFKKNSISIEITLHLSQVNHPVDPSTHM